MLLLCKTFRVLLARERATFSSWALHLLLRRLAFEKFHKVKIGSSLQPERIPATFAGLVEVQLCVDSFMTIHMCSSLWICINFQNVVISLATAHIMCSWLVASRNCHRHLCSSPSEKQSSAGSANVCSGPSEEQGCAELLAHERRTDFGISISRGEL